jgi:hypothetical protein
MKNDRISDLSEAQLRAVYAWVDQFTLSKQKKDISRDFSDGLAVAEIVSVIDPAIVEVHNYPSANSVKGKLENWKLLSKKPLKRLGVAIGPAEIDAIVNRKPMAVESFLYRLMVAINGYEPPVRLAFDQERRYDPVLKETASAFNNPSIPLSRQARNVDGLMQAGQEATIQNLRDTVELLTLKIEKVQKMLDIKDQKIAILERAVAQKWAK